MRVRIILEVLDLVSLKYFLKFEFKATNNESKYEALIVGLKLAKIVWVMKIKT